MESRNQNDIARDIKDGIGSGRYKNCVHLTILQPGAYGEETFHTGCQKSAFEYPWMTVLSYGNPKCPDDCDFFVDKAEVALRAEQEQLEKKQEGKKERRKQNLLTILKMIPAPFNWLAKLTTWTQLAIIFLIILAFAPNWIPFIIELVRAIQGK